MTLSDLNNKQIAVVGYGMEGKAIVKYLLKHKLTPVLVDELPWEKWSAEEQLAIKSLKINFIFGPDAFLELGTFDIIFRSPGIPILKLKQHVPKTCIITSQTKWFFDHCPSKIIGITGTKGKGTTTSLIYHILKTQTTHTVYLTGNIGQTQPLEILDELTPSAYVVYELSSFQLQDLDKSPHIAVVLMVTSEHLDYHKDLNEYQTAKANLTRFQTEQDFAVINADYENSVKIGKLSSGKHKFFSRQKPVVDGCYLETDAIITTESNFRFAIKHFPLRGKHNLENICASILVARILKVEFEAINHALTNFKGLEHRLEFVANQGGIQYFNDSFSTTPETAIGAISSFFEPLIVILGGSSKNSNFTELGKTINTTPNLKAVILIGEEAKKIQQVISRTDIPIYTSATNMKQIFEQIHLVAQPGDVVLLSPACASFGMFKNYKDRGEQFKYFVAHA